MFVITGGGTGGHLAIANAFAKELKARKFKSIYIGSIIGQDKDWFEKSDDFSKCYFLDSTGVVNKKGIFKIFALFKAFKAALTCIKIFKTHKAKCVISVGGFSAGGASIGAILSGVPLFIHEQNAIKGKLNAILSPFAKAVFGSFESSDKNFISMPYPIREEFFTTQRVRQNVKHILFLGGSQGAKGINDLALSISKQLLQTNKKISHQCGQRDFERVKAEYEKQGILDSINLFAFDKNLINHIKNADIAISRSGASSLWELAANGLCSIFIPYPYAAKDHQFYNAKFFTSKDLGIQMRESEIDKQVILDYIDSVDIKDKSQRLIELSSNNGASKIIDFICQKLS